MDTTTLESKCKRIDNQLLRLVYSKESNALMKEFVLMTKITINDSLPLKSACVSLTPKSINIEIDPDFIDEMNDDELLFILSHEINHVLLGHINCRLPDKIIDNIASDLEQNQDYLHCIPVPLRLKDGKSKISGVHYDQFGFPERLVREEYYKLIQENKKKNKKIQDLIDGLKSKGLDDHGNWDGMSESSKALWKDMVKKMAEDLKSRGLLPAHLMELLQCGWKKSPSLKKKLKRVIGKKMAGNVTETTYWKNPDRRYPHIAGYQDTYLGYFIFAIDTSGSMGSEELTELYSVIRWVKKLGYNATLIQCDAEIHDITDLNKLKPEVKISGRGGTSSLPVFNWIKNNKKEPDMMVFFTDLETDFPPKTNYPVIWYNVSKNKGHAPFGTIIDHYEI